MGFKFQGFDFLHLDSSFNEDELLVRRTARDFVEDNLIPIIEECFRTERFPRELVPAMGELGFFGANLEGYGCAGMSNVEYGLVMQELERGDSGFRSFVSVQSALVMYPIYTFGSDEQKNTWLPALASGEKLGCFGLTEPGFGSNPGGMTTTARKSGDEYILNGEKMWITSGTIADVAVIWAKVEDEDNLRPRLPCRNRPPRLPCLRSARQVELARLRHQRPLAPGRPHPRRQPAARHRRPQEPAHVPQPGPLRHQLGGHRRGHVLLRHGAPVRQNQKAIPQPAHRQPPAHPGKAGLDGSPKSPRPSCSRSTSAASKTPAL